MSFYAVSLDAGELLEPAIRKLKGEIKRELEKLALEIVETEVAKFAINLSDFVSIQDMGHEIRITIVKEIHDRKLSTP